MSNEMEICSENNETITNNDKMLISSADVTMMEANNNSASDINAEAFKFWIHCNKCFYFFFKKTTEMFLLSCHHTFCEKCLVKHQISDDQNCMTYKCAACSKIVRVRRISNDLPNHLKELFHPKPWLSTDLSIVRIINFQQKHREHLFKAMENLEHKCIRREKLLQENQEIVKNQENELRKRCHENMVLERRVRPILASYKHKKRLKIQQQKHISKSSIPENRNNSIQIVAQRSAIQKSSPTELTATFGESIDLNSSYIKTSSIRNTMVTTFADSIPKRSFNL